MKTKEDLAFELERIRTQARKDLLALHCDRPDLCREIDRIFSPPKRRKTWEEIYQSLPKWVQWALYLGFWLGLGAVVGGTIFK